MVPMLVTEFVLAESTALAVHVSKPIAFAVAGMVKVTLLVLSAFAMIVLKTMFAGLTSVFSTRKL